MTSKLKYEDLTVKNQYRFNSWIHSLGLPVKKTGTLSWIYKYSDIIYNHIMNGFVQTGRTKGKPYTASSKRGDISLLSKILRNYGHVNKADEFNVTVRALNDEINETEKNQEFDENEKINWVSHDEIKTKIDFLKKRFLQKPTLINNYEYLALSLYWYIAPIRNNYCDMQVVKNADEKELLKSDTNNYLLEKDGKFVVIINSDKVSHLRKKQTNILIYGKSILPVDSDEMTHIINESLRIHPRNYLFTKVTDINKSMNCLYFGNILLKRLFKQQGKQIGINILRSSYITWFYLTHPGINDRDKLALKMRHSRQVAELHYNKIITEKVEELIEDVADEKNINDVSINTPVVEVKQNEKSKFDLKAWSKEYRIKNAEKLKQRREERFRENPKKMNVQKLLFNLNNNNTMKPRESTIKFYNLKQDDTGKWFVGIE